MTVDITEERVAPTDPDDTEHLEKTSYIDYEVNGKKYEHVVAPVQSDTLKVGDTMEILCQSKDPTKISGRNPGKRGIIFTALGAVVAHGGLIAALKLLIRRR